MSSLGYGFCTTHPDDLLKEEIEYRRISRSSLAKQMGVSYTALNDILNERRSLTAGTAILFEAALGVNADLLMCMQLKYNMQIVRQDKTLAKRIAKVKQMAAIF